MNKTDMHKITRSLEQISHLLPSLQDLENINKNLQHISFCLDLLCYMQYIDLKKHNLENKIDLDDLFRSFKCKS